MYKKLIGYTILLLYFLVLAVAITSGPLVSYPSLILGIIGLIVVILGISSIAKNFNLVDSPDNERKTHFGKVPLVGGIVLFVSMIYGTFILGVEPFYRVLIISLVPIMIIGIIDDAKGLSVPFRIIAQILASWIVIVGTDVYLRDLGNLFGQGIVHLNQFGIPFTIFAVVGICNAFNMLDGKDGLTGSVSMITIFSLFILLHVNDSSYNWGLILLLSLLIFLAFNLNLFGSNRKIFLGDHGAVGLGHLIAWNLVYLSQETEFITPVSALWFIFYPLTDALLTITRRVRSSKSIFDADRKHLHHILSDYGFSDLKILMLAILVTTLGATLAVSSNLWSMPEDRLLYGYLTVFLCLLLLGRGKP